MYRLIQFIIAILLASFFTTAMAQNNNTFPVTITAHQPIQYQATNGDSRTLLYQFTVTNNFPIAIPLGNLEIYGPDRLVDTQPFTTCPLDGKTKLPIGASCDITYTSSVPSLTNFAQEQAFLDQFSIDSLFYYAISPQFGATVFPVGVLGRLVFQNKNGSNITDLDLAPSANGSVTVVNAGVGTVSNVAFALPASIKDYFTNNCTHPLIPGGSYTLGYTIPSVPADGDYVVTASGSGADNSPHALNVSIASRGRLTFRQGINDVNTLNLDPGTQGAVTLVNTGGSAITSIGHALPSDIVDYLGGNCLAASTLGAGGSCTLSYDIPITGVNDGSYEVTFIGTNVANSPKTLGINIASQGRFVFRQNGNPITNLDLAPNATGSVTVVNTGGSPITAISRIIPEALRSDFDGDCLTKTSLNEGQSCTLSYTIPANPFPEPDQPQNEDYQISFSGTNAVNSPQVLGVSISGAGRFIFRHNGNDVRNLDLGPNATGSVTVINTGGSPITNIAQDIPQSISSYFPTNPNPGCLAINSLAPNQSCTLNYTVPADPSSVDGAVISFSGDNANNSPHTLTVDVSSAGRFTFRQNSNDINVLNLGPLAAGSVTVVNTGGSAITGITPMVSPELSAYFPTDTGCLAIDSLAPNQSCTLNYTIPNSPPEGDFQVSFAGSGASTRTLNVGINLPYFAFVSLFQNNVLSRCDVDPDTGSLINCVNPGGSGFLAPQRILVNSQQNRAYITNAGSNGAGTIIRCDVSSITGNLGSCNTTGGFLRPFGIALTPNSVATHMLVANFTFGSGGGIRLCDIDPSTGNVGSCSDTGSGLSRPRGMAINPAHTLTYLSDNGTSSTNGTIHRCSLNATSGELTGCTNAGGSGFSFPSALAFNVGGTRIYIANGGTDSIRRCDVDLTTGELSNCSNTGASGFLSAQSIILNATKTRAYIARSFGVTRCDVDPATGAFSNCAATGARYTSPQDVELLRHN